MESGKLEKRGKREEKKGKGKKKLRKGRKRQKGRKIEAWWAWKGEGKQIRWFCH